MKKRASITHQTSTIKEDWSIVAITLANHGRYFWILGYINSGKDMHTSLSKISKM
jgi:hypothetical protein